MSLHLSSHDPALQCHIGNAMFHFSFQLCLCLYHFVSGEITRASRNELEWKSDQPHKVSTNLTSQRAFSAPQNLNLPHQTNFFLE